MESVAGRGAAALHDLQCVEEVIRLSKLEQRTRLPRASRIGGTVRSGWSHDCSDTSTTRYIIYNIEIWGCLKARIIQRKLTLLNVPWRFLLPPPPRREKNIHNLPKTPDQSNFLITSALTQGQIPWTVPIHESSVTDPYKRIHTQNQ